MDRSNKITHYTPSKLGMRDRGGLVTLFTQTLSKIQKDHSGSVATLFGLMAIALFGMIGAGVDYGRWTHAQRHTQNAMDAAVLAGGRVLQLDSSDISGAISAAELHYAENVKTRLPLMSDTISFVPSSDNTTFTATGNAEIGTPFLSLVHVNSLKLFDTSQSQFSIAETSSGKNVEISIMLDVTSEMAGTKLSDMKVATKKFIDQVVWDDQSKYSSRVALVPFSQSVNVGATYFNAITNQNTVSLLANSIVTPAHPESSFVNATVFALIKKITDIRLVTPAMAGNGNDGDDDDNNSGGGSSQNYDSCVVDRSGHSVFTDAAPGSGSYFSVYDAAKQSNNWTKDMACRPGTVSIQPLTDDKVVLHDKVDNLVADGYSAGHVGTAFTWNTLSPKWSNVWPTSSTPSAYDDQTTKKVAVLMAGGDYDTKYNNNSNGNSAEQAASLCENMKAEGISIYTIAFDVSSNSDVANVLENCASNKNRFYQVADAASLTQAYSDIVLNLTKLHLSR